MAPRLTPPEVRFQSFVEVTDGGCHQWRGAVQSNGYGRFTTGTRREGNVRLALAHRWAYERWVAPIPDGMTVDHLCRNRGCVNPAHMEIVSRGANTLRGESITATNKAKTHCLRGHELKGANLYVTRGHRQCRTCKNEWQIEKRKTA